MLNDWQYPSFSKVIVPAVALPVTVEEMRPFVGLDDTDDYADAELQLNIEAATAMLEDYYQLSFMIKTYQSTFECCSPNLKILRTPNFTITKFVYFDGEGAEQEFTVDDYYSTVKDGENLIVIQNTANVNTHNPMYIVEYTAAFDASDMALIKQAVIYTTQALYNSSGDCSSDCGQFPCKVHQLMRKYFTYSRIAIV